MKYLLKKIQRIHFVGIGGIGMSGIAELLAKQGIAISGSDLTKSPITDHLEGCGCKIWQGHDTSHVEGANAVVYSSAVDTDNPELLEAREKGIPVIRRAEMLGELMRLKTGVAIAGTHGKTTTTSMVGHILTESGLDPTVIVGGVLRGLGTNARLGESDLLIAEADEYDRSFLNLTPTIALITNLEAEHLDTYGSFENLRDAFLNFANSAPFYGTAVINSDDPNLVDILPEISRPVVTYGFNPHADFHGEDIKLGEISSCTLFYKDEKLGEISIPIAGRHNLSNAIGSVAIAREFDLSFEQIQAALKTFEGVKRRFEFRGEVDDIVVYDDYAHHPTEVEMTLKAARLLSNRRLIAVFQPHLYSRTQTFYSEFAKALMNSDMLIITGIFPSREEPIEGVTSELIVDRIKEYGHKDVYHIPERKMVADHLAQVVKSSDMVLCLGAGDINKTSDELLTILNLEDVR